jgi:excisionase family DNA binding protein
MSQDVHTLRATYSIAEVCKVTGLGRTTIYKAIASGSLVAVKCGSRTMIFPTELNRWMSTWAQLGK